MRSQTFHRYSPPIFFVKLHSAATNSKGIIKILSISNVPSTSFEISRICAKCDSRRRVITRAFFVPQLVPVLANSTLALRIKHACLHMSRHLSCYQHKCKRTNDIFKWSCQIYPNPVETCHSCLHFSWFCCALELIVPTCHIQRKHFPTKRGSEREYVLRLLIRRLFSRRLQENARIPENKKNYRSSSKIPPRTFLLAQSRCNSTDGLRHAETDTFFPIRFWSAH